MGLVMESQGTCGQPWMPDYIRFQLRMSDTSDLEVTSVVVIVSFHEPIQGGDEKGKRWTLFEILPFKALREIPCFGLLSESCFTARDKNVRHPENDNR
jgi:hypothetical protein